MHMMSMRKRALLHPITLYTTFAVFIGTELLLCHANLFTNTVTPSVTQGGTQNLAQASLNVLSANLRTYAITTDDSGDGDDTDNESLTYITPCTSDAVGSIMDVNEAMLAARALAKSGRSDVSWQMVRSVLAAQSTNGFIPRYIYFDRVNVTADDLWLKGSSYPNYPLFGILAEEYLPMSDENVRGSGMLAASPFLSSIALDIFYLSPQSDHDEDMLEDVINYMYDWHNYLHSERVDYSFNIIHPWESMAQLDSPVWDIALLEAKGAVQNSGYSFDRGEIPDEVYNADDYPGDENYTAMLFLIDCLASTQTAISNISERCPFTMTDVGIASMLYQADIDLYSMSDMLNDIQSKTVISTSKTSQMELWVDESGDFLESLWRKDGMTSSYYPHYTDQLGGNSVIQVPIVDNFLPLWRGWNNYLIAQNPDESLYSGEFRDLDGGRRLDQLSFQIIEEAESMSPNAFGCNSLYSIRSHGCNYDSTQYSVPVISPISNYFLARGLELNGALGISHFVRNTTMNLACRLYPNSDRQSVDECPLDPTFSKRFDVVSGASRLNGYDLTCDLTSTAAAAVTFDLLFSDGSFEYDEGIPIASIWVTLLIAAELIIALVIMMSCVLLSINLMRSLKYDDDEMILRMLQDSRFKNQWGMRHEEANLIYGQEFSDGVFDENSGYRQQSVVESVTSVAPPSHRNLERGDSSDVTWRGMFRTYAGYINPFRFKQPEGILRNNEGTLT